MKPSDHVASNADFPGAFASLAHTFRLGYRAEPRLLAKSMLLALLMMAPDALLAVWLKLLIDGASAQPRNDGRVVVACVGLAVSVTLTWLLNVLSSRVQRRFRDRVAIALESHVAKLQASIPSIEHHERPEYLDRLSMLRNQVFALDHMFMSLFSTLGWMFRLVIVSILLATVHPLLVLLFVASLPAFWASAWRPAVERSVEEAATSHIRLARHLFALGTNATSAKELRVMGAEGWLAARRDQAWRRWYRPVAVVRRASAVWYSLVWAVFAAAYVGAIVFVSAGLDRSVGDVVLVVVVGVRLAGYVGATASELGFLRGFWLDASRRLAWLEGYAADASQAATKSAPHRLAEGIRLDNVTFRYPGTDRNVLDQVTLTLPAGSVVAIVGENGAGKSTLVKLLAGMYRPTSGAVMIDDINLAEIPVGEWRSRLAGAFQDFYRFEFNAQQSVGIGELADIDDVAAAATAVRRAGADDVIEQLPAGLSTQLGPAWHEGVDLSFGQWQKIALARGFMRDEPLLLTLDEPTAALDAETEHALFERFAEAARADAGRGRVTVLVSHRFSTVRMADLIVVLDGNRLAECGSHEALMSRNGLYAELYTTQAAAYQPRVESTG